MYWLTIGVSGSICECIIFVLTEPKHSARPSSQSVARLNNSWSNDITRGPKRGVDKGRSNFAGREDLEMTRRYRDEGSSAREFRSDNYGMVFDIPSDQERRKRNRTGDQDYSREQRRKRSKSPLPSSKHRDTRDRRQRSRSRDRRSGREGR